MKEGVKRRNPNMGEMVGFFHQALIALVTQGEGFARHELLINLVVNESKFFIFC